MKRYIGIDLGGTNIAGGIADENGKILLSDSVPTKKERPTEQIMEDIAGLVNRLIERAGMDSADVSGIGVGCPGMVDSKNGIVTYCVNVPMKNVKLGEYIEKRTHIPVKLENDANAAALGEYRVNGKGAKSYILITLGTGIGAGAVLDGRIYGGFNGAGMEAGHMTLVHKGIKCSCGKLGCWEKYGSVTALVEQTKRAMEKHPESLMHAAAKRYGKVSGRTAFEAAKKGDAAAAEVVGQYAKYVADGVTSLINLFQPEILAIGGGISKEGDYLLKPIVEFVRKNEYNRFPPKTKIEIASLTNDAGIIGAALACAE